MWVEIKNIFIIEMNNNNKKYCNEKENNKEKEIKLKKDK